jgi:hypothetical protein
MKQIGPHSTGSCNKNVNGGSTMGGTMRGQMDSGMDLSKNATNVIARCPSPMPEYSPSATSLSKNR